MQPSGGAQPGSGRSTAASPSSFSSAVSTTQQLKLDQQQQLQLDQQQQLQLDQQQQQIEAMQAMSLEHSNDLSGPANANLAAQQKVHESSPHDNTSSDASGQSDSAKARENQMHLKHPIVDAGNGIHPVPPAQQSNSNSDALRMSCLQFTEQQLHVLKAQILAFRRIKKGESSLPCDILQVIAPPSLVTEANQDKSASKYVEEHSKDEETNHAKQEVGGESSVASLSS